MVEYSQVLGHSSSSRITALHMEKIYLKIEKIKNNADLHLFVHIEQPTSQCSITHVANQ